MSSFNGFRYKNTTNLYNTSLEVTKANTLICRLNGRAYWKVNDGWALAAYAYWGGNSTPVIVSHIATAVVYSADSGGPFSAWGSFDYGGTLYYYGGMDHGWGGNYTYSYLDMNGVGRLQIIDSSLDACAKQLLDRYFRNNGY